MDDETVFQAFYDARTRRLAKTEGGATTLFRYDGGTNFQELKDDQGQFEVFIELVRAGGLGGGIGSVLYSDKTMAPTPGAWEGFVYNAVGHTVMLTNSSGVPTQRNVYEAFGQTIPLREVIALTPDGATSTNTGFDHWAPTYNVGTVEEEITGNDGVIGYVDGTGNPAVLTIDLTTAIIHQTERMAVGFDWEALPGGSGLYSLGVELLDESGSVIDGRNIAQGITGSESGHITWDIAPFDIDQATADGLQLRFTLNGQGSDEAIIRNLAITLTHISPTDLNRNNRLANTKERDASIGLDNHGFRYYDPEAGRYTQRDPIGYGDGLNVYAHVSNNPVNGVDPLGLVGAGINHWYPLHLGGSQAQPAMEHLDEVTHTKFHKYFADKGFGGPNQPDWSQELGRQKWRELSPEAQREHLVRAAKSVGKDDAWVQANMDGIMADATPGRETPRGTTKTRLLQEYGNIKEKVRTGQPVSVKDQKRVQRYTERLKKITGPSSLPAISAAAFTLATAGNSPGDLANPAKWQGIHDYVRSRTAVAAALEGGAINVAIPELDGLKGAQKDIGNFATAIGGVAGAGNAEYFAQRAAEFNQDFISKAHSKLQQNRAHYAGHALPLLRQGLNDPSADAATRGEIARYVAELEGWAGK